MTGRSGPLLLIAATLGGWLMLRSLFIALSAPAGGLPPLELAEQGLSDPILLPPLFPYVQRELYNADGVAITPPALHGPARRARPPQRMAAPTLSRPVRALTAAAPLSGQPEQQIVAAQSLLLRRMLAQGVRASMVTSYAAPLRSLAERHGAFMPAQVPPTDRWSLSTGLYIRRGVGEPALGRGPALGGSQAWARLNWRPGAEGAELFARLNSAGQLGDGAEIAVGVAHRPVRRIPVQLVAERRQRIGRDGRSAFAAYAAGGGAVDVQGWQVEGYAAAGIVGASRQDGFAEGSATVGRPLARIGPVDMRAGGGVWTAIQPGVARVDIGPSLRLHNERADNARLAIDWRQRVAGNGAPGSGPAVTLSMAF